MIKKEFTGGGPLIVALPDPVIPHASGLAVPLDMTDIYRYEALIGHLPSINSMNGAYYMQQFLAAKELTSSLYCKVMFDYERAKKKAKEEYAVAYLERSNDYMTKNNLKSTDETKKQYCEIDRGYQVAKDQENFLKALLTLLEGKVYTFQSAHDDAKKIYDSTRDPRGSLPAMPSGRDSQ